MSEKRITKAMKYDMVKEIVENSDVENKEMLVEFLTKEIEINSKKVGRTTKAQKENDGVIKFLYERLAAMDKVTISEFMKDAAVSEYTLDNGNNLSSQKISALFKKMIEDAAYEDYRIYKIIDKKKSYFTVSEPDGE